ncbi:MAG: ABC transporter substrate-binding protein [Planctomycetota bacterium]
MRPTRRRWILAGMLLIAAMLAGCRREQQPDVTDEQAAEVDSQLQEKYGKSLDELPEVTLVIISPHPDMVEKEFTRAFMLDYALAAGKRARLQWRNIGGGTGKIVEHLMNVYQRAETSEMDIVWGGGEYEFGRMARAGILAPMDIPADYKDNVPATFNGLPFWDDQNSLWAGSAVSGFGILYNKTLLERYNITPPGRWEEMGDKRFNDLLALADPTQSGSAAATYEMIVQSGGNWPDGWARLLGILGNVSKFYDGASDAANAVIAEAPVATCIDFYGTERVENHPDDLVYISPAGQTAFGADPIGILKNPPHPELAQAFVDFVLSARGQALWALSVGTEAGPAKRALGRQPIRRDFYTQPLEGTLPYIVNFYEQGKAMAIDADIRATRFNVLRMLIKAAAIDNLSGLQAAKDRLIATGFDAELKAVFDELPPDVRTMEQVAEANRKLRDATEREKLVTGWSQFFRDKYDRIRAD